MATKLKTYEEQFCKGKYFSCEDELYYVIERHGTDGVEVENCRTEDRRYMMFSTLKKLDVRLVGYA